MALLFMESFDHYGNGQSIQAVGKWSAAFLGGSIVAGNTIARTGTFSGECNSYLVGSITKVLAPSGGFVVGFAVRFTGTNNQNDIVVIQEGVTDHLSVSLTATATLKVTRGGTTLTTGTTVIAFSTWYYIEFKGTIHDTTGSYELLINGISELSATNVDTRNGGTGIWDRVLIRGGTSGGGFTYFDDFYVCDTSGAAPRNTYLGAIKIECLMPQTDAVAVGSNTGLTPSSGTDHGALVDEIPPNTTDYNSSPTVGVKDTYNYPSMTLTGTIYGIQTNLYVAKSDAVARSVCAVVRSGGVDSDGVNINPATTFQYFSEVRPVNTNGGAEWTTAAIATIEAGMKVTV